MDYPSLEFHLIRKDPYIKKIIPNRIPGEGKMFYWNGPFRKCLYTTKILQKDILANPFTLECIILKPF